MSIQSIGWEDYGWGDTVTGLLDLEVHYHGGGSDRFFCDGVYKIVNDKGVFIPAFGKVDLLGVSGITCHRVGTILIQGEEDFEKENSVLYF